MRKACDSLESHAFFYNYSPDNLPFQILFPNLQHETNKPL